MGESLFESAPNAWWSLPRLDFLWRRRVLRRSRLMWSCLTTRSMGMVRRTAIISLPSELHEILGTEGCSDPCEGYLARARSLLWKSGPAALPVAFVLVAWVRSLLRAWPVRAVLLASCSMPLAVRRREGRSVSLCCGLARGFALSCSSMRLRMPWKARRCLRWRLPPRVRRLRVGVRSVALWPSSCRRVLRIPALSRAGKMKFSKSFEGLSLCGSEKQIESALCPFLSLCLEHHVSFHVWRFLLRL